MTTWVCNECYSKLPWAGTTATPQPAAPASLPMVPPPGGAANSKKPNNIATQKIDGLFFILGFFIPLLSPVFYFLNRENAPDKARGALLGGLCQVVLCILVVGMFARDSPIELRLRPTLRKQLQIVVFPTANEMEAKVLPQLNQQLAAQNAGFTCTSVSLVMQTKRRYTGTAQFSDGTTGSVVANLDEATDTTTVDVVQK
ncbi:MAG TPA: hypothetical protein VF719_03245 [Abditibacteriaceae bacterium]